MLQPRALRSGRPVVRPPPRGVARSAGAAALALGALLASAGVLPAGASTESTSTRTVLGHAITVTVRGVEPPGRAEAALDQAFAAAERVAQLLLLSNETSEIGILNQVPMRIVISVAPETARALRLARDIAETTDGAYDPTAVPLYALWGLPKPSAKLPRQVDIDAALRKVDWENLVVSDEEDVASRDARRTRVDLGEVATGALLDAALSALRTAGAEAGRVSTSAQHAVFGGPWTIALSVPAGKAEPAEPEAARRAAGADGPSGQVELIEGGLAVAAPRIRWRAEDGSMLNDRIDPRSGRPATATRWVVLKATDGAAAAAGYAAAVFAMGRDAGRPFVEGRPPLEAAIAPTSAEPWVSSGLGFRHAPTP